MSISYYRAPVRKGEGVSRRTGLTESPQLSPDGEDVAYD